MKITRLEEAGYEAALKGINLSYRNTDIEKPLNHNLAKVLAHKQGGHNKFLEAIQIWLEIKAPRYWWQQFDAYRVGITKQSESTMHSLTRRKLTLCDFEGTLALASLDVVNYYILQGNLDKTKRCLPESFLQTRIVNMNYKALQNIYRQRKDHKLIEWAIFIEETLEQLDHSEFIRG